MFLVAVIVMIGVFGLWIHAMNRAGDDEDDARAERLQNRWIIGGGLVLPLTSMAALLAFGIPAGHSMLPLPPEDGVALDIEVTAHQWHWDVYYPEQGIRLHNELHIPANAPVDIYVTSSDVIHSFWVPRLAGKIDAIPGHTSVLRLEADEPGDYRGQCAEFCGRGHAHMQFRVSAHSKTDFETWQREASRND